NASSKVIGSLMVLLDGCRRHGGRHGDLSLVAAAFYRLATPAWRLSLRPESGINRRGETRHRNTSIRPIACVVRNGKLVIPNHGILEADLAISGEKIVQIGSGIADAKTVIDAKGQHVFPGCVDTHSHYGHCNEFYDEMATESKCLASL